MHVWAVEKIDILEKLRIKFKKYTLKVKMTTCNNMVYGELGSYPLCLAVKELKRIIGKEGKEIKLSRTIYIYLLNLYNSSVYV